MEDYLKRPSVTVDSFASKSKSSYNPTEAAESIRYMTEARLRNKDLKVTYTLSYYCPDYLDTLYLR